MEDKILSTYGIVDEHIDALMKNLAGLIPTYIIRSKNQSMDDCAICKCHVRCTMWYYHSYVHMLIEKKVLLCSVEEPYLVMYQIAKIPVDIGTRRARLIGSLFTEEARGPQGCISCGKGSVEVYYNTSGTVVCSQCKIIGDNTRYTDIYVLLSLITLPDIASCIAMLVKSLS